MNKGKLIVICGIDGAGKTTLENNIIAALNNQGLTTRAIKQPTDDYRQHPDVLRFLDKGEYSISMETLAVLSAADRAVQIDKVIKPALASGHWVICNRYVYSAFAYFENRGVDIDFVKTINQKVLKPDYGILIDLSAREACARVKRRDGERSKYEEKKVSYMEQVRQSLLRVFPNEFLTLNGTLSERILCSTALEYINQ